MNDIQEHENMVEDACNDMIDLHESIDDLERRGWIIYHRGDYIRYLIELSLLEAGHSLKGMKNLSVRHKGG